MPLEPPPHSVVNTLWFPPVCVDAFVGVALVAVEALCACNQTHLSVTYILRSAVESWIWPRMVSQSRLKIAIKGQTYASSQSVRASLRPPSSAYAVSYLPNFEKRSANSIAEESCYTPCWLSSISTVDHSRISLMSFGISWLLAQH